mmetsp:Transcript_152865/g.292767  ORF Transcript_152865/g.292767 Transcript_152865/m.292767 type:complete len:717 (+) Transcript_152865:65-2215(+)
MPISEKDALAVHKAIHGGKASVKLTSGEGFPVETNSSKCKVVNLPGVKAMEQNQTKSSEYAKMAKAGSKITWIMGSGPGGSWGLVVDGVIEKRGSYITADAGAGAAKAKSSAAAAKATAKADTGSAAAKAKSGAAAAKGTPKAAAKAKGDAEDAKAKTGRAAKPIEAEASEPPAKKARKADAASASASGSDPLGLSPLFAGMGHGGAWEPILRPVLEGLPSAAKFIGPARDKRIVPVRELTFQALKPNPPGGWKVVSLGQSPYPRIESATGIAHFDSAVSSWEDSKFGSVVTMRCIIKAAAMHKYGVPKSTTVPDLRKLLKEKKCVGPAEWFQAMLTQGVLFMNASCTLLPPEEKGVRASEVVDEHSDFWRPVILAVVDAILQECSKTGNGIVFAWWGGESRKIKSLLEKQCLSKYPGVKVEHVDASNPAAMGDMFCNPPNVFENLNKALAKLKLGKIDWLPSVGWEKALGRRPGAGSASSGVAKEMGDFIAETKELHQMYLDRLKDGLDKRQDSLPDITGISKQPLVPLAKACKPLGLEGPAGLSVNKAEKMSQASLTVEEAAAIHLYTTNHLYKKLNEALRHDDRKMVTQYFLYLRLLLCALRKLPATSSKLYRGVALDLSAQYAKGSEVTWWAVSSCTPDIKVANSFSAGKGRATLFMITAKTGVGIKDFSEYKNEEEFILSPGTQFKVAHVEKKPALVEIHLEELDRAARVR